MLYDEVVIHMDEYDLELRYNLINFILKLFLFFSGITLDDSFTLPESILTQINSSIQ